MRILSMLMLLCLPLLSACRDPGPPPGGSVAELQRIDQAVGEGPLAEPGSILRAVRGEKIGTLVTPA